MMQLRKCVNHPYLIEFPLTPDGEYKVDEDLVRLSGKMMMLERMLTALLKEGHKVQGVERREGLRGVGWWVGRDSREGCTAGVCFHCSRYLYSLK